MFYPFKRWLWSAIFPVFFFGGATAFASETMPGVSDGGDEKVLKLNVSNEGYPPYLILSEQGEHQGIAYDVITRIAERMGYEIEAHRIPRKRVDEMLLEGLIDATPRAREWTEEPDKFIFTDAITPIREVFFSTAESDFRFTELDSLKDITLVTPLGYHFPQLEPLFKQGRIKRYEVAKDRDMFTYLLHGQDFDAAVADLALGQWIIRKNDWQGKFKHSKTSISAYDYRLMLRPGWEEFVEEFNRGLAELKESGELDDILDRYR